MQSDSCHPHFADRACKCAIANFVDIHSEEQMPVSEAFTAILAFGWDSYTRLE